MVKIYMCTNDSIEMDLIMNDTEGEEVTSMFQEITEELNQDRHILKIDGCYLMGAVTATYLKMQHNIECSEYELE